MDNFTFHFAYRSIFAVEYRYRLDNLLSGHQSETGCTHESVLVDVSIHLVRWNRIKSIRLLERDNKYRNRTETVTSRIPNTDTLQLNAIHRRRIYTYLQTCIYTYHTTVALQIKLIQYALSKVHRKPVVGLWRHCPRHVLYSLFTKDYYIRHRGERHLAGGQIIVALSNL